MTREELQQIRAAAYGEARKTQPTTPEDMSGALITRGWLALAAAADHVDALLGRAEEEEAEAEVSSLLAAEDFPNDLAAKRRTKDDE